MKKHTKRWTAALSAAVFCCSMWAVFPMEKPLRVQAAGEKVAIDAVNFPDEIFRSFVSSTSCDTDSDGFLSAEEIAAVTTMNVSYKGIEDLTGIGYFTALYKLDCYGNGLKNLALNDCKQLEWLDCSSNELTELDITECTQLTVLECSYNELETLDLSGCASISYLGCTDNQLTKLELGYCPDLYELYCDNNHITSLDVAYHYSLSTLSYSGNPLLMLSLYMYATLAGKDVDTYYADSMVIPLAEHNIDPDYMSGFFGCSLSADRNYLLLESADGKAGYSYDAKEYTLRTDISFNPEGIPLDETHFPDATFRTYLQTVIDTNVSNTLSAAEILACETLDLSQHASAITDLTGIRYFTALETLICPELGADTLDLSGMTALRELDCSESVMLQTLNLDDCAALYDLDCCNASLESLSLAGCSALLYLDCSGNTLTELDLADCTALTQLLCSDNRIEGALDLNRCTTLQIVKCNNNLLTALAVDQCTALEQLDCSNNQLTSLELTNCTALDTNILAAADNRYGIALTGGSFDLTQLPGGFDVQRTSEWSDNAIVEGNTLRFRNVYNSVQYTYDFGNGCKEVFTLLAVSSTLPEDSVTISPPSKTYTGEALSPDGVVISCNEMWLENGIDYEVTCEYNVNVGTATVIITALGNFWKGTVYSSFIIDKAYAYAEDFTFTPPENLIYDGQPKVPQMVHEDIPENSYSLWYIDENGDSYSKAVVPGTYTVELQISLDCANYYASNLRSDAWSFTIEPCPITELEVPLTPPAVGEAPASSEVDGEGYTAQVEWHPVCDFFDYATRYTATITVQPKTGYALAEDIVVGENDTILSNADGVLVMTREFDATRYAELYSVEPITDVVLDFYAPDAQSVIDCNRIIHMVNADTEEGAVVLSVYWELVGSFDASPNAQNTFRWTVDTRKRYTADASVITGTITVTNDDYVMVNEENFPDAAFRALIAEQYDTDDNGALSTSDRKRVTIMYLYKAGPTDLTGLEHFFALQDLTCDVTTVTELDLSQNTALRYVDCGGIGLERLDVSGCTLLERLICNENALTELDLSHAALLQELDCSFNELTELDLSHAALLQELDCSFNELHTLKLPATDTLIHLECEENQLTALEVSAYPHLETLVCGSNPISVLDFSQNTGLVTLDCSYTQITELNVQCLPLLKSLKCRGCAISELDLTGMTALETLYVSDDHLTYLHLDDCTSLYDFSDGAHTYTYHLVGNTFDTTVLPEGFDISRIYGLVNCTVNGTVLTVEDPKQSCFYNYDIGQNYVITVELAALTCTLTEDMVTDLPAQTYTGSALEPKPAVLTFVEGEDYTLSYANNINAGTATLTVTAMGDFCTGSFTKEFTIEQAIPDVTPVIPDTVLTEGDPLPELTFTGVVEGIIRWVTEFVDGLTAGLHTVVWEFTPDDTANYESVQGSMELSVETTTTTTETTTTDTTTTTTETTTTTTETTTTETTTSATTETTTTSATTETTTTSATTETTTTSATTETTTTSATTETTTTSATTETTTTSATTETTTTSATTETTTTSATTETTTTSATTETTTTSATTETTTTSATTETTTTSATTETTTTSATTETTTTSATTETTTTSATTETTTTSATTETTTTSATTETTTTSATTETTTTSATTETTTTSATTETTTTSATTETTTSATTETTTTSATTETTTTSATTETTTTSATTETTTTSATTETTTTSATTETTTTSATTETTTTSATTETTTTSATTETTTTSATTETTTTSATTETTTTSATTETTTTSATTETTTTSATTETTTTSATTETTTTISTETTTGESETTTISTETTTGETETTTISTETTTGETETTTISTETTTGETETTTSATTTEPVLFAKGDADCDGDADVQDAALVLDFAAGILTSFDADDARNAAIFSAVDIDADGAVTATDAALILGFAAEGTPWEELTAVMLPSAELDMTELEALLAEAESLAADTSYTEESLAALQAAVDAVRATQSAELLPEAYGTQMMTLLQNAMDALEENLPQTGYAVIYSYLMPMAAMLMLLGACAVIFSFYSRKKDDTSES